MWKRKKKVYERGKKWIKKTDKEKDTCVTIDREREINKLENKERKKDDSRGRKKQRKETRKP